MANFKRLSNKMKDMQSIFFHFMNSEFVYLVSNSDKIWSKMSDTERKLFPCDVRSVDWVASLQGY